MEGMGVAHPTYAIKVFFRHYNCLSLTTTVDQLLCRESLDSRSFPLDSLGHPNARNVKPAALMDTSVLEEVRKSGFIDKLYGRAPKNER